MPSTIKPLAKSRELREINILSGFGNMNVILGGCKTNSIERELDSIINGPEGQLDLQPLPNRENSSQEN